jgi:hypothetical protein
MKINRKENETRRKEEEKAAEEIFKDAKLFTV